MPIIIWVSQSFTMVLWWLLRNQVYDSDIKAFCDANESLFKMASGKAKAEDYEFKVGFRVIFTNGGTKYTMEKYALFCHKKGELIHEESRLDIMETVNNADTPILDKGRADEHNQQSILPLALHNYAIVTR